MKSLLLKYVPPLAVSLLLSLVYHNFAFSALVAAVAFAFTFFDFFTDRPQGYEESLGGKVFGFLVLGVFLGSALALLFGHNTLLIGLVFNTCLCAGWGCMFPRMIRNGWKGK